LIIEQQVYNGLLLNYLETCIAFLAIILLTELA